MLTYAEVLEKQAARHSATMELPEPNSGLFFLRLVRLPKRGRETVVDIFSAGHRFRVRVTRFLSPLRDTLSFDKEKKEYVADMKVHVPIELSASFHGCGRFVCQDADQGILWWFCNRFIGGKRRRSLLSFLHQLFWLCFPGNFQSACQKMA